MLSSHNSPPPERAGSKKLRADVDPLDRDATAADLQPGPILRLLVRSTVERNHRLARRCRLHLREIGYGVTVQRPDLGRVDEAAGHFDELVAAVKGEDFRRASAAVELLRRAFGVAVMLVPARVKGGIR